MHWHHWIVHCWCSLRLPACLYYKIKNHQNDIEIIKFLVINSCISQRGISKRSQSFFQCNYSVKMFQLNKVVNYLQLWPTNCWRKWKYFGYLHEIDWKLILCFSTGTTRKYTLHMMKIMNVEMAIMFWSKKVGNSVKRNGFVS